MMKHQDAPLMRGTPNQRMAAAAMVTVLRLTIPTDPPKGELTSRVITVKVAINSVKAAISSVRVAISPVLIKEEKKVATAPTTTAKKVVTAPAITTEKKKVAALLSKERAIVRTTTAKKVATRSAKAATVPAQPAITLMPSTA